MASSSSSTEPSSTNIAPNALTKDGKSPLLHAWHDPLANIKTNQSCVKLVDLNCDGDSKLCICDYDKKLRVYKGTNLLVDYAILETPIAIAVTYMDATLPRIPSIAVAAGSYIFLYRQLRPYRKWTCPTVDISVIEAEIWASLRTEGINPASAVKRLTELRDTGTTLSYRSMELLALDKEAARLAYIEENKEQPLVQNTLISCMDVLKKDSDDADAISLLVVGTESGQLFILPQDPQNSNVLCRLQLPATPALLAVSGVFDVEWRITVICRDGRMYSVKNGEVRGTAVLVGSSVDLGSQAVAVARQDKQLWLALMDRSVGYYSARGKRLKMMIMQEDVAELSILPLRRAKVAYLLLVALVSGEILMCKETMPLHSFRVEAPVLALNAGLYGREENSVVIVHGHAGSLTIKMWRRTVDVDAAAGNGSLGPPPEQDIPLPVPKKTKLFVEQTQRERDHAAEIHRAFQRDLCKLRLTTARAYVQTLTDGLMTAAGGGIGSGAAQDIRISVQVQGLGPKFLLRVTLQNSGSHTFTSLRLVFAFDASLYAMGFDERSSQSLSIPVLLPGPKLILETQIKCIDALGRSGQILCLVYRDNAHAPTSAANGTAVDGTTKEKPTALVSATPLLSAAVKMPAAEPLLS